MDTDTLASSPLFHKALFNGLNGADIALTVKDGQQSEKALLEYRELQSKQAYTNKMH